MANRRNRQTMNARQLAKHLERAAAKGIVGKIAEAMTHDGRTVEIHLDERGGAHQICEGQDVTDPTILEICKRQADREDRLVSAESAMKASERTLNDAVNLLLRGEEETGLRLSEQAFRLLDEAERHLKDAEEAQLRRRKL